MSGAVRGELNAACDGRCWQPVGPGRGYGCGELGKKAVAISLMIYDGRGFHDLTNFAMTGYA